jgi:hypothetical protein
LALYGNGSGVALPWLAVALIELESHLEADVSQEDYAVSVAAFLEALLDEASKSRHVVFQRPQAAFRVQEISFDPFKCLSVPHVAKYTPIERRSNKGA